MSGNYNSFINFKQYRIDNMYFKINNDYIGEKDLKIDTKFAVDYYFLNESNQVEVTVNCELFSENFKDNGNPFYLFLSIIGEFDVNYENVKRDDVSVEVIEQTMKVNTLAILFPYVRSTITSITSAANVTPIILPPVNTNLLLKAQQ